MFCADGILLKEVNRLLRSNGYFVYSGPPAYRKDKNYPMIWDKLVNITSAMCWKLIARKVQTAIWKKDDDQSCLLQNAEQNILDMCDTVDESTPSWNTPLRNCVQVKDAQTHYQELPSRPERLSVYSESLSRIGLSLSLTPNEEFTFSFLRFLLFMKLRLQNRIRLMNQNLR